MAEIFKKYLGVKFYTSSIDKYLQALYVFNRRGYQLEHFQRSLKHTQKGKYEPYEENHDKDKYLMLGDAIAQVKRLIKVNSLFFVEDTSIRIDALSSKQDFPGKRVKEWFSNTNFEKTDNLLKANGNIRTATVYSDIALHIPGLHHPVFFHGETSGKIATTPPSFESSTRHPWLTPNNFNGWFIPKGATKRLGEMPIEESLDFDFRVSAISNMLDRIDEYTAVINIKNYSYYPKRDVHKNATGTLFRNPSSPIIIIGNICAGKTEAREYLTKKYGYKSIEASSIAKQVKRELAVGDCGDMSVFFEKYGYDVIARRIYNIFDDALNDGMVISGFRTIAELMFIRQLFKNTCIVYVEASERIRCFRYLNRNREDRDVTVASFNKQDEVEKQYGLFSVAKGFSDVSIKNNTNDLELYHSRLDYLSSVSGARPIGITLFNRTKQIRKIKYSRLYQCLKALAIAKAPLTSKEISELISTYSSDYIDSRHINWALREYPEFVERRIAEHRHIRYMLKKTGLVFIDSVDDYD